MPAALSPGSAYPGLHLAEASKPLPAYALPTNVSPTSHSWTPPVTLSATKCVSNLFEGQPTPFRYSQGSSSSTLRARFRYGGNKALLKRIPEPLRSLTLGTCQFALFLGGIESSPASRNQIESPDNESRAQQMKRPEMWRALPPEQHFQQMPAVVGKPVHIRIASLQPARQEIECQREPVHFREQRDEKSTERPERAPVPLRLGFKKAECKKDKGSR